MPFQNQGFLPFTDSTSFDTYVCIDVYHRVFFVIICLFGELAREPYITHSCFKCSNMYGIALIYIQFKLPTAGPISYPESFYLVRFLHN